jgi:hypothetical protein
MNNAKPKPIIYSPEMIREIIAGRKTMTRRLIKPGQAKLWEASRQTKLGSQKFINTFSPWQPGDILYARENFIVQEVSRIYYEDGWHNQICIDFPASASGPTLSFRKWFFLREDQMRKVLKRTENKSGIVKTRPSIHLPMLCARIWQRVQEVKFERLLQITDREALEEGIEETPAYEGQAFKLYKDYSDSTNGYLSPANSFSTLWDRIYGRESTLSNPWVWVLKLKLLATQGPPTLDRAGNVVPETKTTTTSKIFDQ